MVRGRRSNRYVFWAIDFKTLWTRYTNTAQRDRLHAGADRVFVTVACRTIPPNATHHCGKCFQRSSHRIKVGHLDSTWYGLSLARSARES